MDVSVRRSSQSTVTSALILVVCSAVCFCVGIGVGFMVWGPESAPGADAAPDAPAVSPPPDANDAAVPSDPAMQHLESLAGVWPARHLIIAVDGTSLSAQAIDMLATLTPGGVVLTQRNVQSSQQTAQLIRDIKEAVALGNEIYDLPLIAADQEGGVINRLNLGTAPGAREIAERRDLEHARQVGKTYAEACAQLGVGVMLAPVLDIFATGAPAQMESRTFGTDEKTVTAMGLWFASGVIEGGVIPVAKHYPGMGGVKATSRNPLPVLNQDIKGLAITTYSFGVAVEMKIPGILAGHVSVPVLDMSDPPRPASLSPTMINTVLRDRWGYNGVILSDDIALEAVTESFSLPDAAVEALASGCDAVIVTETDTAVIRAICDRIESAVQNGELANSALQESKERLDGWQAWLRTPTPLEGSLPDVLPEAGSAPPTQVSTDTEPEPAPSGMESEIIYTVQSGDALSKIAAKYDGVSTRDIIEWNNLSNATIRVGQDLRIRVQDAAPVEPEPEVIEVTPAPLPEPEVVEPEPEPEPPAPEPMEEPSEPEPEAPTATEHVVEKGDVLSRIAAKYGVTTNQLMEWNNLETSRLTIGQKLTIGAPSETEAAPDVTEPQTEPEPEAAPEPEPEPEPDPEPAPSPSAIIEYVVEKGDVLSRIASKFDVTTKQIMEWNNLENTRLSVGQKLMIGAQEDAEAAAPEPEVAEPEPEPETPAPETVPEPAPEPETPPSAMTEYVVEKGDALSRIASKFDVTTKQIMEWNNLDSTQIRVGQTLSIVPGESSDTPEPETAPTPEPETPVEPEPEPESSEATDVTQKKHSVQLGESLSGIAAAHGVTVTDLISWNDLDSDAKLQAGRVLTIYVNPKLELPDDTYGEYVIQSGDSPLSIADRFEISPEELMRINGITDVNTLRVGQALRVPKLD